MNKEQTHRLGQGGAIDRRRVLRFTYDSVAYQGHAGDTLASALLANGVHLIGRSFKYHRPRGVLGAGAEEPNALVQLERGARTEPNERATQIMLVDGLVANSQNCWPSVRLDIGALNDTFSALFPAGFYYKTFMWPPGPRWWLRYEHLIRKAAGMGRTADAPDPDHYAHRYAHCDVLVIGAGPAGLAAARAALAQGARVMLCDESASFGGSLCTSDGAIDGAAARDWVARVQRELAAHPDATLLEHTTAFGYYDDNLVGLLQRVQTAGTAPFVPRQRLWKVRARRVVLASGAIERSIAYANNDLPGTLLADAARIYVERYGVRPGSRAVVFTNNDSAYASALALHRAGIAVAAVVDARPEADLHGALVARTREAGLPVLAASVVTKAHGRLHVRGVDVALLSRGVQSSRHIACDLVCVSGGWNPAVHLFSQARGKLRFDANLAAFVPDVSPLAIVAAGAANGRLGLDEALAEGHAAGSAAALQAGCAAPTARAMTADGADGAVGAVGAESTVTADGAVSAVSAVSTAGAVGAEVPHAQSLRCGPLQPLWEVASRDRSAKRFVDLQNDVTVNDIALASREGYQSVEHLKRYTTLGMGTDQGKTSNVVGLALLAAQLGRSMAEVGTTTFRPPYTPISLGALPGHAVGAYIEPTRRTAMHAWHAERGARFVNAGLWKRPHSYPQPGESEFDAANREALNVRTQVGLVDVSTLGKIELQGRDVAELLNRMYINRWDTLQIGRCRYGVMLRDDGIVLDDGTTSRLGDTHYLMTTTTVNAVRVMQQIELLLQRDWPELQVHATSVTEQWAAAALSGPNARAVLEKIVDIDVANAAFPFLAVAACQLRCESGTIPARLFRMSYSGENAYEIHVPADQGSGMWEAVMAAGEPLGIMPYGTEAMGTLRIEKGHVVVGAEADGRTTADDLGLGKLVNAAKWCIGKPLLERPALTAPDRWQLVGLSALDGAEMPRAAKLVADPDAALPNPMLGHVTAWCFSPNLKRWIALALLANGRARHGETLWAVSPLAKVRIKVRVEPACFIDPEGARLRV
ncbi:MAG: 2Fe-2S iron-sulfur cluster-binding protein [Burkholderiaceae bacterium]